MITVKAQGFPAADRTLAALAVSVRGDRVGRALAQAAELTLTHMQRRFLSGSPLRVRTGKLRSNWIVGAPVVSPSGAAVAVGTNTRYAPVQNFGFTGPEWVRAHVRSRPKARRGSTPRSQKRRARARSEARLARADRLRKESASWGAHGMSRSELKSVRLEQRRSRGLQGGIADTLPPEVAQRAGATGSIPVRAHGRYMKLRGHHFVERALRETEDRATALFWLRLTKGAGL